MDKKTVTILFFIGLLLGLLLYNSFAQTQPPPPPDGPPPPPPTEEPVTKTVSTNVVVFTVVYKTNLTDEAWATTGIEVRIPLMLIDAPQVFYTTTGAIE